MSAKDEVDCEYLSEDSLAALNYQQQLIFAEFWEQWLTWIREKGKKPARHIGYSASNVRPLARRVYQVFAYYWNWDKIILELTQEAADHYLEKVDRGDITTQRENEYAEPSKSKFRGALKAYFKYKGVDWTPEISFSKSEPANSSDPFTQRERELLLDAALEYKSPPTYANVTPEERDRWNAWIAQDLGKPKAEVTPEDWETLSRSWKIPSLISSALDAGWRAAMVDRLNVAQINKEKGKVIIPPGKAVKNDAEWKNELSTRTTKILRKWLSQRKNKEKYDDSAAVWLNRKGNRYNSKTLNRLLRNLMDNAGIEANGRKLTWHSIRHSTGMYLYERYGDLGIVAEVLRHQSLESARKYAHPTPESKQSAIEEIQGNRLED
jgi:integrase